MDTVPNDGSERLVPVGTGVHRSSLIPAGATHSKDIDRAIARVTFFNLLLSDEQTQALYRTWIERDGWQDRLVEVGATLDRLAQELGRKHRYDLYTDPPDDAYQSDLCNAAREALEIHHATVLATSSRCALEIEEFLSDRGIAWRWLADSLVSSFFEGINARLWDITVRSEICIDEPPNPPQLGFSPQE